MFGPIQNPKARQDTHPKKLLNLATLIPKPRDTLSFPSQKKKPNRILLPPPLTAVTEHLQTVASTPRRDTTLSQPERENQPKLNRISPPPSPAMEGQVHYLLSPTVNMLETAEGGGLVGREASEQSHK